MKITGLESETAILTELGKRLRAQRISLQYSQAQLAEKCGLSETTVKRIENGNGFHISQLIKLMATLGIAENLNSLIPEETKDYKSLFEKAPQRKRVKASKQNKSLTWKWGDETE